MSDELEVMTEVDVSDVFDAPVEAEAPVAPKRKRAPRSKVNAAADAAAEAVLVSAAAHEGPSDIARWGIVAVLGVVVIGLTAAAPAGLRRIDAFHIDRVEIYGAHYMTAEQVLAATRITKQTSIFDDVER